MRRLCAPLVFIGLCVAACSSTAGSSASADRTSLAALLQTIPDTAEIRELPVRYSDFSRLRNGKAAATATDDLKVLSRASDFHLFVPSAIRDGISRPEFADYAGFDSRAIDATLEFGLLPDNVAVLVGTMSASAIGSALATSPGGDALVTKSADGVTYFSLGEPDASDFDTVSAIRRIGEPLRLAAGADRLYWTRSDTLLDASLKAADDATDSLGDDHAYAAVAAALDAAEVVNAVMLVPLADEGWTVTGAGETFQGDTSTMTLALHYETAAAATAAGTAFRAHVESGEAKTWSDTLTITAIEVRDTVVVATLTSTRTGVVSQLLVDQTELLEF